jgi:hypothetical protein
MKSGLTGSTVPLDTLRPTPRRFENGEIDGAPDLRDITDGSANMS